MLDVGCCCYRRRCLPLVAHPWSTSPLLYSPVLACVIITFFFSLRGGQRSTKAHRVIEASNATRWNESKFNGHALTNRQDILFLIYPFWFGAYGRSRLGWGLSRYTYLLDKNRTNGHRNQLDRHHCLNFPQRSRRTSNSHNLNFSRSPKDTSKMSDSKVEELAGALYARCLADFPQDHLIYQQDLLNLGIIPGNNLALLMKCVQSLVAQSLLRMFHGKDERLAWKLVSQSDADMWVPFSQFLPNLRNWGR